VHQVRSRWSPDSQSAMHFARGLCTALGHSVAKRMKVLHPTGNLQLSSLGSFGWPREMSELATSWHTRIFTALSGSFDRPAPHSAASVPSQRSQVASFGRTVECITLAPSRCVAAPSVSSVPSSTVSWLRVGWLPNNALVPTANRHAPVGSRSQGAAPAAHRGRWAKLCEEK
jgi:hypothetical protein